MSRDQGLSIFEDQPEGESSAAEETQVLPTVAENPSVTERAQAPVVVARPVASPRPTTFTPGEAFAQVRRGGYDRFAVDAQLEQLLAEKARLEDEASQARQQTESLAQEVTRLREQMAEVESPSYAGLGGRAASMLRLAEEEASEVRQAANKEAEEIRSRANADAAGVRATAHREAEDMRVVQLREIEETRQRVLKEAETERELAKSEAADMRATAQRAVDQLKLAAEQETTELRTGAVREAEKVKVGADREVAEARRTLAVEKERLAREASDHHNNSMAETNRLVQDAADRAEASELRAQEAMALATQTRQTAQHEAENLLGRARREAEQIVTAARAEAEAVTVSGNSEAKAELDDIRVEVERLGKRRDSITAQLSALRDVMGDFGKDDDPVGE